MNPVLVRTNINDLLDSDGKAVADVTAGNDYGYAMALQPDGKIVMAGWVGSDFGLIRFNADGSRDMTFDDGAPAGDGLVQIQLGTATDRAFAIALDPSVDPDSPRIVVAGSAGGDFLPSSVSIRTARSIPRLTRRASGS